MARLLERYRKEILPKLRERFDYENALAAPQLEKVVVSMGVGRAAAEAKALEVPVRDLALITGQKPLVTKAKKSVAGFKLRKGTSIGCKVTLRGKRMYEFLDRLINIDIPRFRDFRGLSDTGFDDDGNYNLGITDHAVFPEINIGEIEAQQGLNIAIIIRNGDKEKSLELLTEFGMPFKKK